MKKILALLLVLFCSISTNAFPQSVPNANVNNGVTINSRGQRLGLGVDATIYDTNDIRSQYITPTNMIHYKSLVQPGQNEAGACYWASFDQYFTYTAHQYQNGTYVDKYQKIVASSGNIIDNNAASTTALTTTVSGGNLATPTIVTASLPGAQNGTYNAILLGGGGTGTVTFTISSQTIVSASATTTTSFTSAPTILIPSYFWGTATTGTCNITPGDVVVIDAPMKPTVSADFPNMGWTSGLFSGATTYGETTDLASDQLGNQAFVLDATSGTGSLAQLTNYFDTGHQGGVNQVNLNGTWTISYRAKLSSGTSQNLLVNFGRQSLVSCSTSQTKTITTSWANYTSTCIISGDTPTNIGNAFLSFTTNNVTTGGTLGQQKIYFADAAVQKSTDTSSTFFTSQYISDMSSYSPGSIRILQSNAQAIEVWNPTTHHTDIFNTNPLAGNYSGVGFADGAILAPPIQFPNIADEALAVGSDLYYTFPITTSFAEAQFAAEYIFGDGTTVGGAYRIAQGKTTPYGTLFAAAGLQLHLMLGNENWNAGLAKVNYVPFYLIAPPYVPSGTASATYAPYEFQAEAFCAAFKSDPSYVAGIAKVGWGAQSLYQGGGPYDYVWVGLVGATGGQPIITHCDELEYAPYTQLSPTSFSDSTTSSNTIQNQGAQNEVEINAAKSTSPLVYAAANYGPIEHLNVYEFNNSTVFANSYAITACSANGSGSTTITVNNSFVATNSLYISTQASPTGPCAWLKGQTLEVTSATSTTATGTGISHAALATSSVGSDTVKAWMPSQLSLNGFANGEGYGLWNAISFLTMQATGQFSIQNLFTYGQYRQTINEGDLTASSWIWGETTTTPGVYRPTWYAAAAMNACIPANAQLQQMTWTNMPTHTASGLTLPHLYGGYYQAGTNYCQIFVNDDTVDHPITISATSGTSLPTGVVSTTVFNSTNFTDSCEAGTCNMLTTSSPTFSSSITLAAHSLTAIKYTIGGTPVTATPTFAPSGGTYSVAQTVVVSDTTPSSTIYCTTNGTTPTTGSPVYTAPFTVSSNQTLQCIATSSGATQSAVGSASYVISTAAATPTFSPAAGTYTSTQSVTILDATSGATIYYTTDGSTPTTSSNVYTSPISVSVTTTIKAFATASGSNPSAVGTAAYTISATPTVSTPTFNPVQGTYTSSQSVQILDATSGTTIYYTLDGSTPTTSSTVYTSAITVSATTTVKALATKVGYNNSAIGSANYTITVPASKKLILSNGKLGGKYKIG